jgi:hypothetical protein
VEKKFDPNLLGPIEPPVESYTLSGEAGRRFAEKQVGVLGERILTCDEQIADLEADCDREHPEIAEHANRLRLERERCFAQRQQLRAWLKSAPYEVRVEAFDDGGGSVEYLSPPNLKPPKRSSERRFLLPDRHPQHDFFLCDVVEASIKDDMGTMEHPVFSLKKSGDTEIRRYVHNGVHMEVTPSVKGIATVWDKDILIYAISQLMAKINAGLEPHRTVRFKAYDLLVSTNRGTGGREYDNLEAAMERLAGTRLKTDMRTAEQRTREGFGLIEHWRIVERRSDERMDYVEITLSEWLYRAVLGKEVLTLHRDYFRLSSSIDRRLYELGRKHCGKKPSWKIGLELLQKKSGSRSALKEFREQIRHRVASDHLPEYHLDFDADTDMVTFRRREESSDVISPTARPEVG